MKQRRLVKMSQKRKKENSEKKIKEKNMILNNNQLSKLRRPVHISFIQKNILKLTEEQTIDIINYNVEKGIIEESKFGKGYYVLKNNE